MGAREHRLVLFVVLPGVSRPWDMDVDSWCQHAGHPQGLLNAVFYFLEAMTPARGEAHGQLVFFVTF